MFNSKFLQTSSVTFPEFKGEHQYMRKFFKNQGLPSDLARWQETVDQMLIGVETDNPIFIMIDQGVVKSGTSHRRGGKHIDGYWQENINAHGGGHGGHRISASWRTVPKWSTAELKEPEAIILASSIAACNAYVGTWDGIIGEGGDCSNIDTSNMQKVSLQANKTYIGNVGFIHESIPIDKDVERTLVRLNVKNWEPACFA